MRALNEFLLGIFVIQIGFRGIQTLDIEGCNSALGMESGEISDQDLSASSSFDKDSVGPHNARVRTEKAGGAWCPAVQVKPGIQEWLQIDLRTPTVITAVETQGRYGGGHGLEYPTGYMLEYWRPGMDQWRRYKNRTSNEVLTGNINTFTPVVRELDSPIIATKLRFVPWSDYTRTVCMRVEIYGCSYADRLVSYNIPQGFKGEADLRDKTYDGITQGDTQMLTNGLGQLFDGRLGDDDYTVAPYEWIGWRKSDFSSVIELIFDFKDIRNFSSMSFHSNNFYENDVQVFSKARLYFGNVKNTFSNTFMEYSYQEDKTFDSARWVKVTIPYQLAQFIKVELEFASKFVLLSEIQFDSVPVKGNWSQIENKLLLNSTTAKNLVIPIAFNDLDKTTKYRTEKMAVFTFNEMPPEYVGLIVGIALAVAGICAVVVLIVVLRQRKGRNASTVYSTAAYAGFSSYPSNIRDMHMYLNRDGTSTVVAKGRPSTSGSSYVVNFSRIENELLDKLPCSPPPKRPHPTSPPPDYRSETHTDESSEYADPDSPMKSTSEVPLIPPPPPVNKRRASLKLNFANFASKSICSTHDSMSDDSLHYASSVVASPEQAERSISASFVELFNRNPADLPTEFIIQIPRQLLQVQEKLGEGEFGEVYLCILQTDNSNGKLVAVKSLRKTANENAKQDFQKEIHVLSKLKDNNVVQLLGVCTEDEPWFMVVEYMEQGDLNQYLQTNGENLTFTSLIYMASQVASGMKYLESLNLVHRDLATRNCLVGEDLTIKIADFGMARSLYSSDYYKIEGRFVLPIRWMAWECILLGKFTPKTDVWAFGVTLWEILSYAKMQPFAELSDAQVIDNIQHIYHNGVLQAYLPQPNNVPTEIYDLMLECWNREDIRRPAFHEIHLFLQRKCLNFSSKQT